MTAIYLKPAVCPTDAAQSFLAQYRPKDANVVVVIQTAQVSHSDVVVAVNAVQKQMNRDFTPNWGAKVNIKIAETVGDLTAGNPYVVFLTDSQPGPLFGILGYHDQVAYPFAFVYVQAAGKAWTGVLSHEILEMVVDPTVNAYVQYQGDFYDLEIADPVEQVEYMIDKVAVSDFVLPAFFRPGATGPFDIANMIQFPFQQKGDLGRVNKIEIVRP